MQIVRLTQTAPKRRKLLLVDPYPRENPYHLGPSERKAIWFPKLSLPAIAAYTPEHWDVEIQDESVRAIDFEYPADMVGISVMTCYAPRAYEIAAEFRKRRVPVVLGGVHPTYCPDEALQHCDAIVTGEAEDSWPRLVAGFEAGRMQRHYKMEKFPALENYKRSEEHTSELQSLAYLVCRLLLEKKKKTKHKGRCTTGCIKDD